MAAELHCCVPPRFLRHRRHMSHDSWPAWLASVEASHSFA